MEQIPLEELESWYKSQLEAKFSKLRQGIRKLLEKTILQLAQMRESLKRIQEAKVEIKDPRTEKSLERFLAKYSEEFDKIHMPEEINYRELKKVIDNIQKLFVAMNEIGRTHIPRLINLFKEQIKEIDFGSRKLGEEIRKLDDTLRKKYTEAQEAESVIDKMQNFSQIIDKIERTRAKLSDLNEQKHKLEEKSTHQEKELIDTEHDEILTQYTNLRNKVFQERANLDLQLKFKKGLQKARVLMVKDSQLMRGVTENHLKDFLKDPVGVIVAQGENTPQLIEMLVQLRASIEGGRLELKSETKDRILENIQQIIEKRILKENIRQILELNTNIKELQSQVEKRGLLAKVDELKDNIARLISELQHLDGEIGRTKDEYDQAVQKLKEMRESVQISIKNNIGQDVKIQIKISV
ncbi:MAG: hypothetical protein RBG13Loki_0111 [Promethearchaeota archaeon CR_4]|nr:MAG: hypothetical protein RBG13Loki_0111 [Candidatus Lokiarchaeota archaeon CR_4]